MNHIYNTQLVQSFIENEQHLVDYFQKVKGNDYFFGEFVGQVLTDLHPNGKAKVRAYF